jgi:hypothetical protein
MHLSGRYHLGATWRTLKIVRGSQQRVKMALIRMSRTQVL